MADADYDPPPAFAPPLLRTAPMNERQLLGRTTYPNGPYAAWPPPAYPPAVSVPSARVRSPLRRGLTITIAACLAVAVLGIGIALGLSNASGHASRSISLPTTVSSYERSLEYSQDQVLATLGTGVLRGPVTQDDIRDAKAGVYRNTSPGLPTGSVVPAVVFIGFDADQSPGIGRRLHTLPPSRVTSQVLIGAGGGSFQITWAPGPLGGSIRSGDVQILGETATIGIWADSDTLGMILTIPSAGTAPLDYMARLTRRMRAAAEV